MLFAPGMILLPVPVKLDTYFGEPLSIRQDESSEEFAVRVAKELKILMDTAEATPERPFPEGRRSVVWFIAVGIFTFIQNLIIHSSSLILITIVYPLALVASILTRSRSHTRKKLDSKVESGTVGHHKNE
jgi:hypothetical protein